MSEFRKVTPLHPFLVNSVSSTANGAPMEVADYQNVVVAVTAANATVFFQGAIQDTSDSIAMPDFTSAASATNQWAYIDAVDYQDNSKNNGNQGLAFTTSTTRIFEFNTNGLSWVNIQVSGNTGTVTARGKGYSTS